MTYDNLLDKYGRLASEYARFSALVNAASICTEVLQDLKTFKAAEDAAELDLSAAASVSGYSGDHLRRLVRIGRLPAFKRGGKLFFRAGDLPLKPRTVDETLGVAYDPVADARQVAAQRIRGNSHGTQAAA
jgi:hypothetical protein